MIGPLYSDSVYAIAECDKHGDLPHPLSAVHWLATPYDSRTNVPCLDTLHDYDHALDAGARLMREHLHVPPRPPRRGRPTAPPRDCPRHP